MMPDLESDQPRSLISSWQLWLLMSLSLVLAAPLAYVLNIRFDEAFTLTTTLDGPVHAAKLALGFGQQAPLYFVLMSFWRQLDSSIFFARIFSVLCFPLIVWVTAEVSKRYLKGVNPLVAAALVVVHQQVVWNALDIRLYAMMTLLSGLLLLLFYDGYLSESRNTRSRIGYVLLAVISLYTQYYIGFQLVGSAVALLLLMRWRVLGTYIVDMAIAGLIFLPMLVIIATGQMSIVVDHVDASVPLTEAANGVYQRIVPFIISANGIENEGLKRWLARSVIAGFILVFSVKVFRQRSSADISLGAISVVMIAFFVAAYTVVGDQLIHQRHLSGLILPLVIMPLSALTLFKHRAIKHIWASVVVVLSVFYLYGAYKPLAKPGDFQRVAQYVTENEKPNQPVLIFHADAILPLRFYYKGQNPLLSIPQENGMEVWNPRNNVLEDETKILKIIDSQPNQPERFWLIHDGWCAQGTLSFNCQILEDAVDKYFVVESSKTFFAPMTVRLLRRK